MLEVAAFFTVFYKILRYSNSAFLSEADNSVPNSCPHRLLPEFRLEQSVVTTELPAFVCSAAIPIFEIS